MMKPNYEEMTRKELKEYLEQHRDDQKAWSILFKQLSELDSEIGYSPDLSTEEMEKIFQEKLKQIK